MLSQCLNNNEQEDPKIIPTITDNVKRYEKSKNKRIAIDEFSFYIDILDTSEKEELVK